MFRVLVGYGVVSFAMLQVVEPIMHGLALPDSVLKIVVVLLGLGFPIAVVLAWAFDVNQGGIERTPPAAAGAPWLRGPRLALILIGIGVLAAVPGLAWYLVRARPALSAATVGSGASAPPSIAVLPFSDLSEKHDQGYFADGVAEEILNALTQVEGLRVAGRTSSFSFKGKNLKAGDIARELNVAHMLEGSVRREGKRVRITAQLIDAADGYHLWSQTYDRELKSVFAVQDEIARAVVDALKVRLVAGQPPSAPGRTPNPDVYNEYLLGNQFFRRLTTADYRQATAAYERALALDPEYAPAWAGLAMATYWIANEADTAAAMSEGKGRAMAAAEKAVALAPQLTDAYVVRGFLRGVQRWDWDGARADLERALALNPGDPTIYIRYAQAVLGPRGELSKAIAAAKKATDLDPLSALAWITLGRIYRDDGQLSRAMDAFERSLRIAPHQIYAPFHLANTLVLDKRPAAALAAAELSTSELYRNGAKVLALHDLGRTEEAQRLLDVMIARFPHSGTFQIAEAFAWFGDRDRAFEWLERAYQQRTIEITYGLKSLGLLRDLRGDPRYATLLKKMNLPLD